VGKLDLKRYLDLALALLVDDWLSTDSVLEGESGSRSRFLVRVDGAAAGGSGTRAGDAGFRLASCLREGRGLASLLPLPAALPARSARRRVDSRRIFPSEAAKSIRERWRERWEAWRSLPIASDLVRWCSVRQLWPLF
jgi:hypothetical protein